MYRVYASVEVGSMIPNEDQTEALQAIQEWYGSRPTRPFVLGGLAGTGKTALLPMLHNSLELKPRIRYICPTWKAAHVLTKKLKEAGIYASATSIHQLIYNPRGILHEEGCGMWTEPAHGCTHKCDNLIWEYSPKEFPQLLVVDEASMVDPWIRKDIEMLGCPVLYVGDHGQLPPVRGTNVFQDRTPDALLETIQRQALDNPIIPLSRIIRDGDPKWLGRAIEMGFRVFNTTDTHRYSPREASPPHSDPNTVYIAATNTAVDSLNAHTRRILGRGPEPLVPGELVMVQNNNRMLGVYNGQQGIIEEVVGDRYVCLSMETGVIYKGEVLLKGFDDVPDDNRDIPVVRHSYALTGHKAQGSEFDNVVVYLTNSRPETRQWLYTAVTRAKRNLTFVKGY